MTEPNLPPGTSRMTLMYDPVSDGEAAVGIINYYTGTSQDGFTNHRNVLQVHDPDTGEAVWTAPVTRAGAFRLAQSFLNAAMADHWPPDAAEPPTPATEVDGSEPPRSAGKHRGL